MPKKWLAIALKIVVSGGLLWFALRPIDFAAEIERASQVPADMLALAFLGICIQAVIGGFRWGSVLRAIGDGTRFFVGLRIFYIGMFFNQTLPSAVGGDAVRMYLAYKSGQKLSHAINGVMLERAATVVALVILLDVTQPIFMPMVEESVMMLMVPGLVMVNIGAAAGMGMVMCLDRLPQSLHKWRVVRGLGHLGGDARRVFLSIRHAPVVLFWGVVTHANIALIVYVLASGLGLGISVLECLVIMPPVLLITTLPISIGGWGVRETAMAFGFGLIGYTDGVVTLSILTGLVGMAVSLPGGLVWLLTREKGEPMTLEETGDNPKDPPARAET